MDDGPERETGEGTGDGTGAAALVRRYLPELVYGANDGIVTTFAIVAGIVGANLSVQAILILGFASLFADAISMAASNVLSERSRPGKPPLRAAMRCGAATFLGFIVAGVLPLVAYVVPAGEALPPFALSALLAAATLFSVGAARSFFSDLHALRAGVEMLLIGTGAGAVAFGIGRLGARILGGG